MRSLSTELTLIGARALEPSAQLARDAAGAESCNARLHPEASTELTMPLRAVEVSPRLRRGGPAGIPERQHIELNDGIAEHAQKKRSEADCAQAFSLFVSTDGADTEAEPLCSKCGFPGITLTRRCLNCAVQQWVHITGSANRQVEADEDQECRVRVYFTTTGIALPYKTTRAVAKAFAEDNRNGGIIAQIVIDDLVTADLAPLPGEYMYGPPSLALAPEKGKRSKNNAPYAPGGTAAQRGGRHRTTGGEKRQQQIRVSH